MISTIISLKIKITKNKKQILQNYMYHESVHNANAYINSGPLAEMHLC